MKIHVSTFLKETFYQEELSMSRYPRVQSLLLSPKWTKTITLTSDFFPVAPICFQFFFSFHFQTHILHRILSVKPLIGNSKPQQSNWVFRFLAKKKMTNWGGRSNKMLPVFRYLKTVNFTIVPPMNNFYPLPTRTAVCLWKFIYVQFTYSKIFHTRSSATIMIIWGLGAFQWFDFDVFARFPSTLREFKITVTRLIKRE